ncbi:hypothetical protein KIH39_16075 [Telmatocola sphagniphila]|uniref:Uncharacterized protein n=1 Tax=Telmatocola sphagniphila TaxID=1123043 RepID=A0A8E6B3C7_9BACT|nr:hypothetical protein [Telmatocola sphagniphila]QVL30366.1 hypothetical protein KIH39_16075 [Telmatocola sphagniphila]
MEAPKIPPSDRQIAEELSKVEAEPLLPVEKWLIFGSLSLGISLLGLLLWISHRYFPIAGE